MSATVELSSKGHPARQRALEAFLSKLRDWSLSVASGEELEREGRISVGRQQIVVEPWERQQLRAFFRDEATDADCALLVAHGLALVVKSTFDVEQLTRSTNAPSAQLYAVQAELMLDVALGTALLREAQPIVDERVAAGRVEMAKSLSHFRHKLARSVADSKKQIAESEREKAEVLADSLTDAQEVATAQPLVTPGKGPSSGSAAGASDRELLIEQPDADLQAPSPRTRRRRPPAATSEPRAKKKTARAGTGSSFTGLLAVLCAVCVGAWLVFVILPESKTAELEAPAWTGVPHGDLLGETVVRPSSVYVEADGGRWDRLSEAEQDELLQAMGAEASRRGFRGLLLSTDAGRPVGRWLRSRGASRIPEREDPPLATSPPAETTQAAAAPAGS